MPLDPIDLRRTPEPIDVSATGLWAEVHAQEMTDAIIEAAGVLRVHRDSWELAAEHAPTLYRRRIARAAAELVKAVDDA